MTLFDFRKPPPQAPAPSPAPEVSVPADPEPAPPAGEELVAEDVEQPEDATEAVAPPVPQSEPAAEPDAPDEPGGEEAVVDLPDAVFMAPDHVPAAPAAPPPAAGARAAAPMPFARSIRPQAGLTEADLVLPSVNKRQFREFEQRVKHREAVLDRRGFAEHLGLGKSVVALFTGTRGTGKTQAALVAASMNQLDVLKVDLAALLSLPEGERDAALRQVFDDSQQPPAILLFQRAESLFDDRSDPGAARLAPGAHLLWRYVDAFAGAVIFSTTVRSNWGEAFAQRVHVVVEFPVPDADDAFLILKRLFTPNVQVPPDTELREIAERFRLPGGSFENVVLGAAFRAEADTTRDLDGRPVITQRHLVDAIVREYQKLGKLVTRGEFGDRLYAWVEHDSA